MLTYENWWYTPKNLALHFGYYDVNTKTHAASLVRINEVLSNIADIQETDKVLDAGCGVGGSAIWLAKNIHCKVVGINIHSSQLQKAIIYASDNEVSNLVSFEKQDYTSTSFKDKEFSLFGYGIYFINQERRCSLTDPSWLVEAGDKFIPAELTLYLKHKTNSEKYKITIKMRDPYIVYSRTVEKGVSVNNYMDKSRALLRFFDSFYKKAQGKDVELYVDTSGEKLTPKLKAGDLEEEFPDYKVEISNFIKYDYR